VVLRCCCPCWLSGCRFCFLLRQKKGSKKSNLRK
jgi:hypothetical protein